MKKSPPVRIPPTSDRNLIAALSYVWFLSIFILLMKKNDDYVRFHARQALVLAVGALTLPIPFLNLVGALCVVGMVVGFIAAWQGKQTELPIVAGLAEKIRI